MPQTSHEIVRRIINYPFTNGNGITTQELVTCSTGKKCVNGFKVSVSPGSDYPGDPVDGVPSGATYIYHRGTATITWVGVTLNDAGQSAKFDVQVNPAYITTFPGATTTYYSVDVDIAAIGVSA